MRLAIASVLLAGLAAPAGASLAIPRIVQPATYASRSGAVTLGVDPSHRHGKGGATYELTRDGRVLWAGERPFTLLDARVGEDGTVTGYSYDSGLDEYRDPGALHLLILDAAGGLRLDARMPRRQSQVIDGGFEPWVAGLVFDADGDRVVFRVVSYNEPQVWQPYRLSTGAALPPQRPDAAPVGDLYRGIVDAQAVAGTRLTLVHWTRHDSKKDESGVSFSLLDANGTVAWELDLPRDRQAPPGDRAAKQRLEALGAASAILDVARPREFSVLAARSSERVTYVVEPAAAAWRVRESGRAPWSPPPAEGDVELPPAPARALRPLGTIALGGGRSTAEAATRGVYQFDLDDQGRVGFARIESCAVTFVLGSGESFQETPLGRWEQGSCSGPLVAWTGASRWLVAMEYASGAGGWWVDAATGAVRPFTLPEGVSLRAVAGRPGGGFVLLGERDANTVVLWMDARGREERAFSEPAHTSEAAMLGAEDITVTTSGAVAIVAVASRLVAVFDRSGRMVRRIDLRQSWGREPNYPSGISADEDDGFIVDDFGAPAPFVRMRADGTVRATLRPRYADERPTGRLFRVRPGPDGTLWASDGEALLRLREDGIAEAAAGAASASASLGEIAGVALDASDRIYAVDRRSGAVHVFGADGKPSHVCKPDSGDVEDAVDSPSLTVTGDGRVFARVDSQILDGAFLEFTPAGVRAGSHPSADAERLWNPATGGFWAVRWQELALVDEKGATQRTVARRLDRKWLGYPSAPVVGSDGSLAVTDMLDLLGGHESTINVFAPDGTPAALFRIPRSESWRRLAYDGHTIAFWHDGEVRFTDVSGRPLARFRPRIDGREPADWPLFIAAGGRELWMFDGASRTMHRYEMP